MPSGPADSGRKKERAPPPPVVPGARALALVVFGVVLLVYVRTLYPDVAGGDSGELVGAVCSGGVIHPPGYPTYALIGRFFALLPFGNLAWRLNLMSAACDAAAAALLFLGVLRCAPSRAGAVVAAGLFAAAPSIWRYAICAEVFALNNLFVALLFWIAMSYRATRDPRWARWGAFALGLGLGNHQTILFSAIPLVGVVLWLGRKRLLSARALGGLGLFFTAGIAVYLYLPIAAARHAFVTWGDASSWSGFWTHVLRREYGTFQLAPTGIAGPGPAWTETLEAFTDDAREAIGPAGGALALVGLVTSVRGVRLRRVPPGLVALAPVVLSVGVMVTLGNLPVGDPLHRGIVARFWQQPIVWLSVLSGLGFGELARVVRQRPEGTVDGPLELGAAAAIVLLAFGVRFRALDASKSTLVRQYGAEYLRGAPPGALVFSKGDLITNTMRYLQLAEGMRPDVRVVDQELLGMAWMAPEALRRFPEVVLPGARYAPGAPDGYVMKQLLDANYGKAPILICGGIKAGDLTADATYGQWPFGYCDWMRKGTEPVNLDEWIKDSEVALPRIDFRGQPHPKGSWEDIVWGDTWEVRQTRAAHLITVSGRDETKRKYIALAADLLQGIVDENPRVPVHVYRNLATALGRSGLDTPDRRARAASAWQHYLDGSPKNDPQRAAIEQEVARLKSADAP